MKIVEYDDADPVGILHLNLLSLGWPLTPELAARIRRLDPRPLPCFAVYAIEDGVVAGQVGVYRLPMVSVNGPEDVGGACAVCTHPAFSGRGVATRLLEEAHARMRAGGLRFSTLGTARHRAAYAVYRRLGYEEVLGSLATFARRDAVSLDSPLGAERAGAGRLPLADDLHRRAAQGKLGFARRHDGFLPMMAAIGDLAADDAWLLRRDDELAAFAVGSIAGPILTVSNMLLTEAASPVEAVAAIARELPGRFAYLRVEVSCPVEAVSLEKHVFMIKPLAGATVDDARRLFGIGTPHFQMSWLDVT